MAEDVTSVFESRAVLAVRGLTVLLILGILAGLMLLHVLDSSRSDRLMMLRTDHARLRSHIARVKTENERISAELEALETGDAGWRDVARKDFGMIMRGEVVYRFPVEDR